MRSKTTPVRHFYSKVASVSYENPDGTSRQRSIKKCGPRERLVIAHEDDNPYDSNALAVRRQSGEQIGYIGAELAAEIVARIAKGYLYAVFVNEITGGTATRSTRGVNLLIIEARPGVSSREAQRYVDEVVEQRSAGMGCTGTLVITAILAGFAYLAWRIFVAKGQ